MGRKEDEEDQGKVSKDTNGSYIEELTKKCKPLNVQLNRLELPKNGIVLIKDDSSDKLKAVHLNRNEGEFSDSNVNNADKVWNEDSSNDTAETIKKIKEFIASGRCDESRKDQDSGDKKVKYKSKVVAKRKLLHKKDARTNKKSSADVERELERTLKGNDSSNFADEPSNNSSSETVVEKNKLEEPKHSDNDASKISDLIDNSIKNNDLLTTPSRVSKRIQSKTVKFSVKKMLRGDDVNVLKRMIPGYQDNTPIKKERLTEKKVKTENKKLSTPIKSPASPSIKSPASPSIKSPASPQREPQENEPQTTSPIPPPQNLVTSSTVINEPVNTPTANAPSSPATPHSSIETLVENNEKLAALSDKIGKFAIGNGKITVELKGSQQKKVVRIAIPPVQSQSSLPNTSLGPDIIIKRVKPVKKTVVMPDNPCLGTKGIIEKEVFLDNNATNSSKDVKLLPRVNLERITTPKLKENLVKMHKSILRHGRNDKNISKELKLCKDKTEINTTSPDTSVSEVETIEACSASPENESVKVSEVKPAVQQNDNLAVNKTSSEVSAAVKAPSSDSNEKVENSASQLLHESNNQSSFDKTKSRKTAKVTPLTQVKTKNDSSFKKSSNKFKKPDTDPEKSLNDEFEVLEPEKETYHSLFDRYFSTRERYVQHNDSLDSDSSEELNDEIYAHFINIRKRKEALASEVEKKEDALTMYDLMRDISIERPTWNIHVTSDGQAFCLAQVDIVDNVPVMKKVIEVDLDYNVKVFVGGTVMPGFEGNYSSYEDIRQLIYEVDQL